jgi:hypothetical protein
MGGIEMKAVLLGVNRKRVQRLMQIAGIEAIYPKPNLSRPAPGHEIYPYLLRGVSIERPTSGARILRTFRCVADFCLWSP